jgi:hypothetical protein
MKTIHFKNSIYPALTLSVLLIIPYVASASLSKVIESHISTGKYLGKISDTTKDCVVTVGSYGAGSKNISVKIEDMKDFNPMNGLESLVLFDFTDKTKEVRREVKKDELLVEIKDDENWLNSKNTLLGVRGLSQAPITIRIEERHSFLKITSKSISCEITNESRLSEKISFQN